MKISITNLGKLLNWELLMIRQIVRNWLPLQDGDQLIILHSSLLLMIILQE